MTLSDLSILFDIDGTLLHIPDGTGFSSFEQAFSRVYPALERCVIEKMPHTDFELISSLLPDQRYVSLIPAFYEIYAQILSEKLSSTPPVLCPNVYNTLSCLKNFGTNLIVFTGNAEAPAKIKLDKAGLLLFFDDGLYGDFVISKIDLLKMYSTYLNKKRSFIITDSISDIEAARFLRIPVLALATGWTSYAELKQANPDFLLEYIPKDFSDLIDVFNALILS